uniref:DHH family phosphoesterase n=1 Tax=Ruminococcus bromii TaxID=40518 RepID=UPI0040252E3A
MRKRNWTLTPWFIIFSVIMFAMAVVSYDYSPVVFYIELGVSVLSLAVVLITSLRFTSYVKSTVKNIVGSIKGINEDYLEKFSCPVAVIGRQGDIVWCNSRFRKAMCGGKGAEGDNIKAYLSGKEIDCLKKGEGCDVAIDGREYTVYCRPTGEGAVCEFIENTYYKQITREYLASKPCVAIAVFDNAEDFSDNSDESFSEAMLDIEVCLQKWAEQYSALYKKIGNNRYMIIFRDADVEKMAADKFPILKTIRGITINNHSASISVGLCRGYNNIKESELNARKALEMALGRGGDQVAVIKKDNTYEFFGGKVAAAEKASKVRMRVIANAISRVVADCDKIFIMGHKFSDLDCVGAAIGLQCIMEKTFKRYSKVVINRETSMAKQLIEYTDEKLDTDIFISPEAALSGLTQKSLLIIVDTHLKRSLESTELYEKCKKVIIIDHHRKAVDYINNALVFCHEPSASSTCEMCSEIISCLDDSPLTYVQADAMLAGITLDTKNFAVKTGVRTFEAAAYLRKRGANTKTRKGNLLRNIAGIPEKGGQGGQGAVYRGC